jgi:hypothetical protein
MNFKFGTDSLKSLREFESLLTRAKSLPGSGELGDFVKETFVVCCEVSALEEDGLQYK